MFKFHSSLMLVIACVACGSSFSANGGGLAGVGGEGTANGGETHSAGSSSGGDAGESDVGGMGATAGDASAGSGGASAGSGGASAGSGGASAGSGGVAAGAGGATGADCAKLKQQYQALLEKARVCDKGSTDECSPSSTLEPLGCGCPVLVNAKSEYVASAKKARQAYQDAKCVDAIACTSVACVPTASASCAQASASGSGSGFVCTAGTVVAN